MTKTKIDIGSDRKAAVVQGPSELKRGTDDAGNGGDMGRISVYAGDQHVHVGPDSETTFTRRSDNDQP